MANPCKKLTINLAVETLDSIKRKAAKIKDVDCPPSTPVCNAKRLQVVPLPVRKIKKKQIQVCKCPSVEFICPPIPCVCPPCPICPTTAERVRHALKTGLKLGALCVLFKWTWDQQLWCGSEHTSELTKYYKSCFYSLKYGEEEGVQLAEFTPPGFLDARNTSFKLQLGWNKIITSIFFLTIGLPVLCLNKVKVAIFGSPDYGDDDD